VLDALDRAAGRLTYRMPEPRVQISLEDAAKLALKRGIPALNEEAIILTPVGPDGTVDDPSAKFRPSPGNSA
jgi:hypothetical protein